MIAYTKEEIVPSTVISRSFSTILNKLKEHKLEKVAVIRNNEMEAVILPIAEYELLQELLENDEYRNIYSIIRERNTLPLDKYIPFEKVLSDMDL